MFAFKLVKHPQGPIWDFTIDKIQASDTHPCGKNLG